MAAIFLLLLRSAFNIFVFTPTEHAVGLQPLTTHCDVVISILTNARMASSRLPFVLNTWVKRSLFTGRLVSLMSLCQNPSWLPL